MDFWEVIRRRHSVRTFDPRAEVSQEVTTKILQAAIEAPSAGNRQPWHFIVVREPALRRGLAEAAYGQEFVAEAPVVIAVCADPNRSAARYGSRGSDLYCLQDTAAATEHILLAATDLGLGGCWVGAFNESAAARVLGLPSHLRPVALIPIGRPSAPSSRETSRRPLSEVISYR
jgi:nitroreductase